MPSFPGKKAKEFLAALGLKESGLNRLIKAAFTLLELLTFLTAGPDECRAWTITRGQRRRKRQEKIHSDIERGFIRAEIVNPTSPPAAGGGAGKGASREGHVMQDGDVTYFRFNV